MNDLIEITELPEDSSNKSSVFGSGIELLMNEKMKESKSFHSDLHLDDLNNLENELNNLVSDTSATYEVKTPPSTPNVSFKDIDEEDTNNTQNNQNNKTWDGFDKFNNIPINPDKSIPILPQMTKEELLREKFKYLKKLEHLEKNKGVELSKKYNMDSPLAEMMGEYESIMEEKTKQNSIKFQGNMLMSFVNGIEFLNNRFDPFDINLDGWSEQVNENITDYDEIFGELYEKYKSRATMAPELKLLFQLGGSATMVYMTNTMFKSSMPGMDDILRQNPDLMRSFQNAAVNSMAQTNPGFSGFMSNVMGSNNEGLNNNNNNNNINNINKNYNMMNGPPPPIATQGPNAMPPPTSRPGNNNYARPDLNMGKSSFVDDGIRFEEKSRRRPPVAATTTGKQRPEMVGPSDISDILSGLKTKTINIDDSSSVISLEDIHEPKKKQPRRQRSANNTVSLDI